MSAFQVHKQVSVREYALQYAQNAKAWLRDYCTAIKWRRWHPFTPLERKAREATRNEPWGPTGAMLNELADESAELDSAQVIMAVLELRLGYPEEKWRNVYKALQVLEFLLKRGSDHCLRLAKDDLLGPLGKLIDFEYVGPDGRDYGINVRVRAQAIENLMQDEEQLIRDRAQLRSRSNKQYKGFSRTEMENYDGVGRANSWGGAVRNPSIRDMDAAELQTVPETKAQTSRRGAGEMKGVSLEENKKHLAALKEIMSQGKNRTCADCVGGSRPTWASINCGVFICMRCAGIHRGLGVHISIVRSCTLDTWLPDQVKFMARTGNEVANAYWEANLPAGTKPNCESPQLEAYIRRKYSQKGFATGEWPPPAPASPTVAVSQPPPNPSAPQRQTSNAGEQYGGLFWESQQGPTAAPQAQRPYAQGSLGVFPLSADVPAHPSAFQTDTTPPMPVPSPLPHHKPSESLLFHAHTYPDLLSFDDEAFPTGPAGRPVSQDDFGGNAFDPPPPQPQRYVQNVPTVQQQSSLRQPERKFAKPKTRPTARKYEADIIQTNELDLDDLDDVESVGGVSRARIQRPSQRHPGHRQPSVGFDENVSWEAGPNRSPQANMASSNPFDGPSSSPRPPVHQGASPRQQHTQAPSRSGMVRGQTVPGVSPLRQAKSPTSVEQAVVVKPKDPLDELVEGLGMDLLSAPPPRTTSTPSQLTPATPSNMADPFANLEPLETLLSPPLTPQSAPPMPTGAQYQFSPQSTRSMYNPSTSPGRAQTPQEHSGNPFSQPSPFIGEGGRGGSNPNIHFSPVNGSSTVNHGGTPASGGDFGRQMYGNIQTGGGASTPNASSGWSSPNRNFLDIDKLVFQQVETLKASGVKASGGHGHPRGLTENMRKPSMKETRAFAGSG